MSNHFHAILSSQETPLEDLIRDLKKYTSKELIKAVNGITESRKEWLLKKFAFAANRVNKGINYKVWQDGFHPVALTNNKIIDERLNYIHYNPVVQGLVYEPEHYVYSSARDYAGGKGLLPLQLIE
jgi:REP element-mobilizing transposase RayT